MIARVQSQSARGRFRCQVVDAASQEVVRDYGWHKNLILDQGLDYVASYAWCDTFLVCAVGTGNTPTEDDGGISTAVQSGTTVTIDSGTFTFAVGDVGKVIKWTSDDEALITGYIDTSNVTVDVSQSVASGTFKLYRVNQTGLATEIKRTNNYVTGSGNCGTSIASNTLTHRRTWDFEVEGGAATYYEIGTSPFYAAGNNLFSRILLPVSVTLSAGQILRVSYELLVSLTPNTAEALTASISGWPIAPAASTDGDQSWQKIGLSAVGTNGLTGAYDQGGYCNEPAFAGGISFSVPNGSETAPLTTTVAVSGASIFLSTTSNAPAAFGSAVDRSATRAVGSSSLSSYSAGTYRRDKQYTFGLSAANRVDWRSMGIGPTSISGEGDVSSSVTLYSGFVFVFDDFQTKLSTHTLQLVFRYTWRRDLSA